MPAYPKKNSQVLRRKANLKAIVLFAVIAACATMFGAMLQASAENAGTHPAFHDMESGERGDDSRNYSLLSIEPGDTLLSIAGKYRPDGVSVKQYMRSIIEINEMENSSIQAGHVIKLP